MNKKKWAIIGAVGVSLGLVTYLRAYFQSLTMDDNLMI